MHPISTQRLLLREAEPRDFEFIARLMNEEGYKAAVGDLGVRTAADARRYVGTADIYKYSDGLGFNIVERRETRRRVGICGLVRRHDTGLVELGYGFLERAAGLGFATEAARAAAAYSFGILCLRELFAVTSERNGASRRVLVKLGMTLIRTTDERECVYRLGAEAYSATPDAPGLTSRPGA